MYFNPSASTTDFGVGIATVQAAMKNYSTIKSAIFSFTATVLGSIVPVVPDQIYNLGSPLFVFNFEPFKVIPTSYNVG